MGLIEDNAFYNATRNDIYHYGRLMERRRDDGILVPWQVKDMLEEKGTHAVCEMMAEDFQYIFGDNYEEVFTKIYNEHQKNWEMSRTDKNYDWRDPSNPSLASDAGLVSDLLHARAGRGFSSNRNAESIFPDGKSDIVKYKDIWLTDRDYSRYCDNDEINFRIISRLEILLNQAGFDIRFEVANIDFYLWNDIYDDYYGHRYRRYIQFYPARFMKYNSFQHQIARVYLNELDGEPEFKLIGLKPSLEKYLKYDSINEIFTFALMMGVLVLILLFFSGGNLGT